MKTTDALTTVANTLEVHGIPDSQLEAELLMGHVLGVDRARMYAALQEEFSDHHLSALERLLAQRLERYPLAYLLGRREFYGLELQVSPAVMVPRQETETLVERALLLAQNRALTVADVGTGSGAIAIAVAVHLPAARVLAVDVSLEALAVAAANVQRHVPTGRDGRVGLVAGDLLAPITGPLDMVLTNLPYIPDGDLDALQDEVRLYEPRVALAGGPDGLTLVRRLLAQTQDVLAPGGLVLLEISPVQREAVLQAAAVAFPKAHLEVVQDLAGWERVVEVRTLS